MARLRLRAGALIGLLVICGSAACRGEPRPAQGEAVLLELRSPEGQLQLQLSRAGDNFGDERLAWYKSPQEAGRLQRLPNQAGTASLEGTRVGVRSTQDGGLVLSRKGSAFLNVQRRGNVLRLGDGDGLPWGRIEREGTVATLLGANDKRIARAETKPDRVTVVDADGRNLGYVTGAAGPEEALMAFLPDLQPVEQALLLATALPASKLVKP